MTGGTPHDLGNLHICIFARTPRREGLADLVHGVLRRVALDQDLLEGLETDVASVTPGKPWGSPRGGGGRFREKEAKCWVFIGFRRVEPIKMVGFHGVEPIKMVV